MAATVDMRAAQASDPSIQAGPEFHDDDPDRRRNCRLPVNLPAVYRSAQRILDAQVSCLSWNGLRLSCPRVDTVGADAVVAINLPDGSGPLTVRGSVVWLHIHHDELCEMGIRLDALSKDASQSLANFLLRSNHLRSLDRSPGR